MAKPDLNANDVEMTLWHSFLASLSTRTGISQNWLLSIGLVAGAFAAFLAGEGFDGIGWDSVGLLLRVITAVAAAASIVVLLPSISRRIVISLVILFHFGGILSAVTSVDPAPWLTHQIWTYVYRPYLQFFYLNNAYHFYSPEPGPASLMWFCLEYESDADGTRNFRWVLMPDVDDEGHPYDPDGTRIWSGTEYTRRLSLAENAGRPNGLPLNLMLLWQSRMQAGLTRGIPMLSPTEPMGMPYEGQYREPNGSSKLWIQSYVRHVAQTYEHEDKPKLRVTGVKFYQVIHRFLLPNQLEEGWLPNDPQTYLPYFYGEFNADGKMKEICRRIDEETGEEIYRDPFLYWVIPIDKVLSHAEGRSGMIPWVDPGKGEQE